MIMEVLLCAASGNLARSKKQRDCTLKPVRKRGELRVCAYSHAHNLPSPEVLSPYIEEGAVTQRPLQALLLFPWGVAWPPTGPGDISIHPTEYVRGWSPPEFQGCQPSPSDARLAVT